MSFFTGTESTYQTVGGEELLNAMEEKGNDGVNVLDVRTSGEYAGGHIPGAANIDIMSPGFADKVSGLDKEATYYVYCASGNRSKTACSQMVSVGFKDVRNVAMGIMGWPGAIE